jgi:chromosome segregation ATPase
MGQVQAFETQLSTLRDDLSSANQGIESCEAELANLDASKREVDEDYEQTLQALSKAQNEVAQLDGVIQRVEKEVFADLCRKIKISSIREYEESALYATRAASDKALELSAAKAKLESLYVFLCFPLTHKSNHFLFTLAQDVL